MHRAGFNSLALIMDITRQSEGKSFARSVVIAVFLWN